MPVNVDALRAGGYLNEPVVLNKVLDTLEAAPGPMIVAELEKASGLDRWRVTASLARLQRKGLVRKAGMRDVPRIHWRTGGHFTQACAEWELVSALEPGASS